MFFLRASTNDDGSQRHVPTSHPTALIVALQMRRRGRSLLKCGAGEVRVRALQIDPRRAAPPTPSIFLPPSERLCRSSDIVAASPALGIVASGCLGNGNFRLRAHGSALCAVWIRCNLGADTVERAKSGYIFWTAEGALVIIADGSTGRLAICPSCGYPKFGPGLCAFCLPVGATQWPAEAPPRPQAPRPSGSLSDPAA